MKHEQLEEAEVQMKKKYIILTPSISNVGGAEIYCRNKKIFLEENGWDVDIFYCRKGKVLINDLKTYEENFMQELLMPPFFYRKSSINKYIDKITNSITGHKEIVVESHTKALAMWGELVANRISGKHIIYLLAESFKKLSDHEYLFFDFKHRRRELAGISDKSLSLLFKGYRDIGEEERYFLRASCANVVEDVENETVNRIETKDINIGCITRLEKDFVPELINEIIIFANNHKDKNILLVIIGGSINGDLEKIIYHKVKNIENLEVIITGYLFPIPKKIFHLLDIFIGVAGSAKISAREGVPTITLDVIDGKPIGLLGYNTESTLYRDTENQTSLSQLLEDILIDKKFDLRKISISDNLRLCDFRKEYQSHLRFIEKSEQTKDYYNFDDKLPLKEQIGKIAFNMLGIKVSAKLYQLLIKSQNSIRFLHN